MTSSQTRRKADQRTSHEFLISDDMHPSPPRTHLKIAVLGNCQMGHVTRCLQAFLGGDWPTNEWINFQVLAEMADGRRDLTDYFAQHDKVFLQPWIWTAIAHRYQHVKNKIVLYPNFEFLAYHPDLVYIAVKSDGAHFEGPGGHYHSSIAFLAWKAGLNAAEAAGLYNRRIYARLGFHDHWDSGCEALRAEGRLAGLPLDALLERWIARGCFMHSVNHPKLFVIVDVVAELLRREGISVVPGNAIDYVRDYLADSIVWPVYPEVAERLGIAGDYCFKQSSPGMLPDHPIQMLGLEEFVRQSYLAFAAHGPEDLYCSRLDLAPYRQLMSDLEMPGASQAFMVERQDSQSGAASNGNEILVSAADLERIQEARSLFSPSSTFWRNSV